jgi:hypothetical protein
LLDARFGIKGVQDAVLRPGQGNDLAGRCVVDDDRCMTARIAERALRGRPAERVVERLRIEPAKPAIERSMRALPGATALPGSSRRSPATFE